MKAGSQAALKEALERWNAQLEQSAEEIENAASEIVAVIDTLGGNAALRRALTDPARSGEDKAALAERVFSGVVSGSVSDLVAGMVRSRWSSDTDLPSALDRLAVETALASAERQGALERVSDEVFEVSRVLEKNRELRTYLTLSDSSPDRRLALLERTFAEHVHPITLALLRRLVVSDRYPSLVIALHDVAETAAERKNRFTARVTAAVPLSDSQIERLERTLTARYGRTVKVNVAVEPDVVGGIRVAVGDELVDATIATRIDRVRRQFAE